MPATSLLAAALALSAPSDICAPAVLALLPISCQAVAAAPRPKISHPAGPIAAIIPTMAVPTPAKAKAKPPAAKVAAPSHEASATPTTVANTVASGPMLFDSPMMAFAIALLTPVASSMRPINSVNLLPDTVKDWPMVLPILPKFPSTVSACFCRAFTSSVDVIFPS